MHTHLLFVLQASPRVGLDGCFCLRASLSDMLFLFFIFGFPSQPGPKKLESQEIIISLQVSSTTHTGMPKQKGHLAMIAMLLLSQY